MTTHSIKRFVRDGINNLPGVGPVLLHLYRQTLLFKRIVKLKLSGPADAELPDPETVYWIDPARVIYHTNYQGRGENLPPEDRVFDPQDDKGKMYDGAWDSRDYRFDNLEVVRALRQRIGDGVEWHETEFYRHLLKNLHEGRAQPWGIESQADLDARCRYLDQLITSVKTQGYQLNHTVQLDGERKGLDGHPIYGAEISVNIGRDGHYFFQDGRHRLAIAQILGIKSVPVKVLVRHKQWVEFRQFMRELAKGGGASSRANELYQNPVHPDLQDIPSAHACTQRFDTISKALGPGRGSLLDIGANLGYFCHGMEDLGYTCFAVEVLPQCARAMDRIRVAENKTFTVVARDLFLASQSAPLQGRHFDVVLALNIFHHFIKQRDMFDRFTKWLNELDVDTMIFEPHCHTESQMVGAYRNFDEQAFVDYIKQQSVLNHAELFHRCEDGRPLYKLWR